MRHQIPILCMLALSAALAARTARAEELTPTPDRADPGAAAVQVQDPYRHPLWRKALASGAAIGINFDFRNDWDRRVGLVHIEQYLEAERTAGRPVRVDNAFAAHVVELLSSTNDQHLREQAALVLGMTGVTTNAVRDALIRASSRDLPVPAAIQARGVEEEIDAWQRDGVGVRSRALISLGRAFPRDPRALAAVSAALDGNTLESYAAAEAISHTDLTRMTAAQRAPVIRWLNTSIDDLAAKMPVHPDDVDNGQATEGAGERVREAKILLLRAVCQPGVAPVCGTLDARGIYAARSDLFLSVGMPSERQSVERQVNALMDRLNEEYKLGNAGPGLIPRR